jgi:DNA-binding LytR/AlgR family response regulator
MMKICLRCNNNRKAFEEILESRNFIPDDNAPVSFVERGLPVPETGIVLVFDPDNLNEFIEFLDRFPKTSTGSVKHIVGKKGDSFEIILTELIIYIMADGNTTWCFTEDYKYEIKQKLYELEDALAGRGFIRINKSYIINITWVEEIVPWFAGRLLLKFREIDEKIEVSRSYVRKFKEYIGM